MNPHKHAEDAYTATVRRVETLRDEWQRLGSPLLSYGSEKQPVPHPLLRAINEAEVLADRLRQQVMKKYRGPEPKAVIAPSPAAGLRKQNGARHSR